jgi:hypothetical protein
MPAGKVEVLNWYGTRKFCDHLTECAYFGVGSDRELGSLPESYDMGRWCDGRAIDLPTSADAP